MRKTPKYLISPAGFKTSFWTPEVWQIVIGHRNKNYLNSLWLGTGWQLASFPYRVFREILWPLFNFRFKVIMVTFPMLFVSLWLLFIEGVMGKCSALDVPLSLVKESYVLSPEQSLDAVNNGYNAPYFLVPVLS